MREKFIQIEIVNEVFLQWPSFFYVEAQKQQQKLNDQNCKVVY